MANYIGPTGWSLDGAVLQTVQAATYISGEVSIANGASYNFPTIAITPKSSASSLIYVSAPRFYSRATDRPSNTYLNTLIYIDEAGAGSTKMHEWINYADNYSTTDGLRLSYPVIYNYANNSTSTRTFNTRAYNAAPGSNTGRIAGEYMYSQYIMEME